jgi:threonine dehydrogenase-like Zn-dependent dehydrogenase
MDDILEEAPRSRRSFSLAHPDAARPSRRALAFYLRRCGYTGEEFAASLDHIADGRIDVTPLITGYVGLGGVKGAFAELANPEQHAKVMVEPWS